MNDFIARNVVHFILETGEIRQWSQTNVVAEIEGFGVAEVVFDPDDWSTLLLTPQRGVAEYKVDLASLGVSGDDVPTCQIVRLSEAELIARQPSLVEVKAELKARVDMMAEFERERYITPGAGQAMVYEAKRREAAAWRALGSPDEVDPAAFGWAAARAARLEISVRDVLTQWAAQVDAWYRIGIQIETTREAAKEAIGAAVDAEAARIVLSGVVWPRLEN